MSGQLLAALAVSAVWFGAAMVVAAYVFPRRYAAQACVLVSAAAGVLALVPYTPAH